MKRSVKKEGVSKREKERQFLFTSCASMTIVEPSSWEEKTVNTVKTHSIIFTAMVLVTDKKVQSLVIEASVCCEYPCIPTFQQHWDTLQSEIRNITNFQFAMDCRASSFPVGVRLSLYPTSETNGPGKGTLTVQPGGYQTERHLRNG